MPLNRRDFIRRWIPIQPPGVDASVGINRENRNAAPKTFKAVVQGRYCLAYQKQFCSVCYERCPVEGAFSVENHLPRVVSDICTGCGICHELCPAPVNAILLVPGKEQQL